MGGVCASFRYAFLRLSLVCTAEVLRVASNARRAFNFNVCKRARAACRLVAVELRLVPVKGVIDLCSRERLLYPFSGNYCGIELFGEAEFFAEK